MAHKVQELAQPAVVEAKQAGQQIVSTMQQPVQDAADHLKETAAAGVSQVKDTAQQATTDTKQAATDAGSRSKSRRLSRRKSSGTSPDRPDVAKEADPAAAHA